MTRFKKTLLLVAMTVLVFSGARMALFAIHHSYFAPLSSGQVLLGFLHGVRFDLSIALTFLAPSLLLMNLPVPERIGSHWLTLWGWIAFATLAGIALLLGGDIAYFGEVHRHATSELLVIGNDTRYLVDMAFGPYLPYLLIFTVCITLLGIAWRRALRLAEIRRWPALGFILTALFLFLAIRGSVGDKPLGIIDAFARGNTALGNLALNGAFSAYHSSLDAGRTTLNLMPMEEAARRLSLAPDGFPLEKRFEGAQPTGHNIVFILMESWSVKYIDSFGHHGYGVTPVFDGLAARGLQFTRFYAAGQRSAIGIQATLTGVPPVTGVPVLGFGLEVANISKLGELANRHGYETIFLQSSRRRSFNVNAIAGAAGFTEYYGMEDFPPLLDYPDRGASKFGWDYETLMFLKNRLDRAKGPFVAYLFTGTTHTPYPPLGPQFDKLPTGTDSRNGFLNTLGYADWSIGEFMKAAEKAPWFKNTVFIFTADHAQVHFTDGEGYLDKFHTPLVIYAPAIFPKPRVINEVGGQLDILPTIVDLLGFDDPFTAMGGSLLREKARYAFTSNGESTGIITDTGYLTHSLSNRLESAYYGGNAPDGYFDELEKLLLAENQLAFTLIKENRWAR